MSNNAKNHAILPHTFSSHPHLPELPESVISVVALLPMLPGTLNENLKKG